MWYGWGWVVPFWGPERGNTCRLMSGVRIIKARFGVYVEQTNAIGNGVSISADGHVKCVVTDGCRKVGSGRESDRTSKVYGSPSFMYPPRIIGLSITNMAGKSADTLSESVLSAQWKRRSHSDASGSDCGWWNDRDVDTSSIAHTIWVAVSGTGMMLIPVQLRVPTICDIQQ